ncbi:chaps-domain-containing protein [Ramicandelaber brevisporus]|nr:chaps-domain-containing protein [Ramicandelaber brevisporus]
MTGDTLRDVPELFENDIGECIEARNAHLGSVRDLGPPDMVHVIKTPYPIRANAKETGSYHYVLGIDGSSSANFAAYLHTLTYNFDVPVGWFGKTGSPTHQIRTGTYCCYNSFSRCDVRVTVSYPGGVEVEVVMPGGHPGPDPTPRFWQEVELSAVIRSLLYTSYEGYRVPALRRLSPMMTQADETRFLETASALFQHGWVLGATSEVQQASLMRNHLTEALRRYFFDSGRHAQAIEFFAPLAAQHPEASAVLAESYIGANLEVEAVQILHNAISGGSSGYPALHVQADLMLSKGRKDAALGLAKMAVKLAPSEFQTWAKLAEVHTDRGEYQQALLALNACPMFTIVEKDVPRLSHQTRARFPIKHEIAGPNGEYDDQGIRNQDESLLLRLPAPNLRGTFSLAYKALTKLVEKVGWDDLLLLRSSVFVMEGEYQQLQQHQQDETNDVTSDIDGASNPSAKAVIETAENEPTSSPTDATKDVTAASDAEAGPEVDNATTAPAESGSSKKKNKKNKKKKKAGDAAAPAATAATAEDDANVTTPESVAEDSEPVEPKRLCERWLDNLFMVLFEDLRAYTMWRTEMAQSQQHSLGKHDQITMMHTLGEWESLGELALRLGHIPEAKDAFTRALHHRFSVKAWKNLLTMHVADNNVKDALIAVVQLTVYNERWYDEMIYPSFVTSCMLQLIKSHGMSKISNMITGMNLIVPVQKLIQRYFTFAAEFHVEGSQW